MQSLDVRHLSPVATEAALLEHLDTLETGEALRIVDDHDPTRLIELLDTGRPGEYSSELVEVSPGEWALDLTSRVRVVDARPTLAAGGEPFAEIMAAAGEVGPGEVLVVYAPFEPVPLEGVLGEQGFRHVVEQLESGDWRAAFHRS